MVVFQPWKDRHKENLFACGLCHHRTNAEEDSAPRIALERHPFSEPVASAGKLLHTS